MKVAIMGAGLSGLTCAIILERNGIFPTIFEKRRQVGDRFVNGEAFLSILTRPVNDVFRFFAEEYQIYLKPTSHISSLTIYSEQSQALINEQIGFINIRGRHKDSFEQQLVNQVKSEIIYESTHTYEELLKEFTHVIIATGDADYAVKLKNYQVDRSVTIKGATVEGKFDRYSIQVWLNNEFAPSGYGYLLPFSEKEANLALAFPEEQSKNEKDNELWNTFYNNACKQLQQSLKVTDQFHIHNYLIGSCHYPRIGNTFFTGNCFGTIMPFIGFGQFESLLTGIYAANDLLGYGKYEELTKQIRKNYKYSLVLREWMEKLNNNKYDLIVKGLDGYVGKRLFHPSHYNALRMISYLLRPLT